MKMWGNVLTIFTHKKMIKHVHEKVKSLFDFLSLSHRVSIDVNDFFYIARESEKDSRIIYPLSDTTPSSHSRYAQ